METFWALSSWTTLSIIVLIYGEAIYETEKNNSRSFSLSATFYSVALLLTAASLPIFGVLSEMQHLYSAVDILADIVCVLWAMLVSTLYTEFRPDWSF